MMKQHWAKVNEFLENEEQEELAEYLTGEEEEESFQSLYRLDPSILEAKNPKNGYTLLECLCPLEIDLPLYEAFDGLIVKYGAKVTEQCFRQFFSLKGREMYSHFKSLLHHHQQQHPLKEIDGTKLFDWCIPRLEECCCEVELEFFLDDMDPVAKEGVTHSPDGPFVKAMKECGYYKEEEDDDHDDDKNRGNDGVVATTITSDVLKTSTNNHDTKKKKLPTVTPCKEKTSTVLESNCTSNSNSNSNSNNNNKRKIYSTCSTTTTTINNDNNKKQKKNDDVNHHYLCPVCPEKFPSTGEVVTHLQGSNGKAHKRYRRANPNYQTELQH